MRAFLVVVIALGACSSKADERPAAGSKAPVAEADPMAGKKRPLPAKAQPRGEIVLEDVPVGGAVEAYASTARPPQPPPDTDADQRRVYAEVRSRLGRLNYCYMKELEHNPDLSGKMVLDVTVGPAPEGMVEDVKLVEATIPNDKVKACVLRTLRGFKFTRETEPPITVTLSLLFR